MTTDISDAELDAIAAEALAEEGLEEVETPAPKRQANPVKTFIKQSQLKEDLTFSQHNLNDAMMNQASLYSFYSSCSAKAQLQADRMKVEVERVEAQIDNELREEANQDGKKVTEALLAKQIRLDPRYQRAVSNHNEAKMVASMTKSTTDAFAQRRDMLVQLGKDQREERLGELRERANQERMTDLKDAAMSKVGR